MAWSRSDVCEAAGPESCQGKIYRTELTHHTNWQWFNVLFELSLTMDFSIVITMVKTHRVIVNIFDV